MPVYAIRLVHTAGSSRCDEGNAGSAKPRKAGGQGIEGRRAGQDNEPVFALYSGKRGC